MRWHEASRYGCFDEPSGRHKQKLDGRKRRLTGKYRRYPMGLLTASVQASCRYRFVFTVRLRTHGPTHMRRTLKQLPRLKVDRDIRQCAHCFDPRRRSLPAGVRREPAKAPWPHRYALDSSDPKAKGGCIPYLRLRSTRNSSAPTEGDRAR